MGQAAVDLPDSLAKVPAPATSADDLLSQLAGEEIDRLLADSDQAAPPSDAPAVPAGAAPVASAAVSSEVVKVFGQDGDVKLAMLPTAARLSPDDHAAIDEILSAHAPTSPPDAEEPEPPKAVIAESETSPAERSALEGVTAALDAKAIVDAAKDLKNIAPAPSKLPLYLKPLQWISMPLMLFPAGARELVGKIAILTLFNAIAVLIYVLIFRTGH